MLVLTRKPEESLRINEDIKVKLISINGRQVKIGIEAPSHITVDREEIHERRQLQEEE